MSLLVELLDDSQSANLEDNVDKSDNPSCKESSDYGSALKRKSCNSDEDYTTDCVKKLMFSNDKQNPDEVYIILFTKKLFTAFILTIKNKYTSRTNT